MCQLLGMNCNSDAAITFSFTGFAARGGRTANHIDGWGMAFYERSGCRVFHDDQPASESPLAEFLSRYPIKSRIVIAHLRRATQGEVTLSNCHPFQREWLGQTWLFANNGDLGPFQPVLDGPYRPVGTTDSEKAFCWLLQELRKRFPDHQAPPGWPELAPHVAALSAEVARHGNFNFLLSNGEALYTHCSSRLQVLQRRHPFASARLVDCDLSLDLSAMNGRDDRLVIVATDPLTSDEAWQALAPGESRVFVDGAEVWRHRELQTQAFPVTATPIGRPWQGARPARAPWPLLLRDVAI